tara:strand:- start:76 stop:552 length:477 start_codon:yes stop_codon:yes gene_type:complete
MTTLFQTSDEECISSLTEDGCIPALTWTQRWYGFCGCFCCGGLMSLLSSLAIGKGDMASFALFYTMGNFISIVSTGFVWGPTKQCKKMFHKTRAIATTIYLVCIVATLTAACADLGMTKGAKIGVCIFLIILQFLALCWYCLSYIPFARQIAKNCVVV